jgi:hypothetical protein
LKTKYCIFCGIYSYSSETGPPGLTIAGESVELLYMDAKLNCGGQVYVNEKTGR